LLTKERAGQPGGSMLSAAQQTPVALSYAKQAAAGRENAKFLRFAGERRGHETRNERPSERQRSDSMALSIDRAVVQRAADGDAGSLNALVAQVRPHVEKQLLRYPVADEDRRDLLQSTLMQVVRRVGSFRGESSFSTWLFRVTANEALMMMRSQRRHRARLVEGLDFEDLGSIASQGANDGHGTGDLRSDTIAANQERDARVRTALDELPADYRDVVVAHYHHDLGLQEIADRMSITESAVRSRLHRARSRLRTLLAEGAETSGGAAAA
jgi:RNA polymerase sigma-70 factor (ECF subfamily)